MSARQHKQWIYKPADPAEVQSLQQALGSSELVCKILVSRGIKTYDAAKKFFRPNTDYLYDPYKMLHMQGVVDHLQSALLYNKKILAYGDYDVDGTMSVSMFYNFFTQRGAEILYYTPDRFGEGYGLSQQGVDYAIAQGVDLLVTLDCGIKDAQNIAYAKSHGLEVIVIDHHQPGTGLPPADFILNPKQKNDRYPYTELCAAGVTLKLLSAYSILECGDLTHALPYLGLAAIATSADVVPLTDENRQILALGLQKLNDTENPIIQKLLASSGKSKSRIDEFDLSYIIGPRINAIGRLQHASEVIRLFTTEETEVIDQITPELSARNEERKKLDRQYTEEAIEKIETTPDYKTKKSTVVYSPDWHKGVIGIVASRLTESYYRPTVVCTLSEGRITCSARSVKDYNILAALDACSDLMDKYGGHFYAAGLSLPPENFEKFEKRFEEVVSHSITSDQLTPKLYIDGTLEPDNLNLKFYNTIAQMAPFGEQNPKPTFRLEEVSILPGSLRLLKEIHLSFSTKIDGQIFKVIGFSMPDVYDLLSTTPEARLDLAVQLLRNEWQGTVSLEFQLIDLRIR